MFFFITYSKIFFLAIISTFSFSLIKLYNQFYIREKNNVGVWGGGGWEVVNGVLQHFQQYFSFIMAVSFFGGGNRREPPTCRKSLTNYDNNTLV